jgi:hypothetical protein
MAGQGAVLRRRSSLEEGVDHELDKQDVHVLGLKAPAAHPKVPFGVLLAAQAGSSTASSP